MRGAWELFATSEVVRCREGHCDPALESGWFCEGMSAVSAVSRNTRCLLAGNQGDGAQNRRRLPMGESQHRDFIIIRRRRGLDRAGGSAPPGRAPAEVVGSAQRDATRSPPPHAQTPLGRIPPSRVYASKAELCMELCVCERGGGRAGVSECSVLVRDIVFAWWGVVSGAIKPRQ